MYDVIVCGGGIHGMWTTHYLAEQGKKVLLLEQLPLQHSEGSSHGLSRITRYSYSDPFYAKMMPEAFKRWSDLEKKSKTQLFVNCGLITFVPKKRASNLMGALDSINIPYELMSGDVVNKTFPGIISDGHEGIYEKTGGILKADKCFVSLQASILSLGGVVHDNEKLLKINPVSPQEIVITTSKRTYKSKSVVLTCGPWINKVLKQFDVEIPIKVLRHSVSYWDAKKPELFEASRKFPAIIFDYGPASQHIYSVPIMEYPGLMKVSNFNGVEIDIENRISFDRTIAKDQDTTLRTMIKKHYQHLVPIVALQETCVTSHTPDGDIILDHLPQHKNIVIGAGYSGSGFKYSPVAGKLLGQLALGQTPDFCLDKVALSRFKLQPHL